MRSDVIYSNGLNRFFTLTREFGVSRPFAMLLTGREGAAPASDADWLRCLAEDLRIPPSRTRRLAESDFETVLNNARQASGMKPNPVSLSPEERMEIRVKDHLDQSWSKWLEGFAFTYPRPDETVLTGRIEDQAAMYGLIAKLRNLGVRLIAVNFGEAKDGFSEADDSIG